MEAVLGFLADNELWIYLVVGLAALLILRWILVSWKDWRAAVFGLEREIVQRKMAVRLTLFVLLMLLIVAEFVLVSFVIPSLPKMTILATSTLDILATPSATLPSAGDVTRTPTAQGTQAPTLAGPVEEGCEEGLIQWEYPQPGDTLSETAELKGTVNVPNLGFYKYEYSQPGTETWNTIAAGNNPLISGTVGYWNTSQLPSGDYLLRLVVVDNANNFFPACVVSVKISNP